MCVCVFPVCLLFSVGAARQCYGRPNADASDGRKKTEIRGERERAESGEPLRADRSSNKIRILESLILNLNSSRNESDCWNKSQVPVFLSLVQTAEGFSHFYLFRLTLPTPSLS